MKLPRELEPLRDWLSEQRPFKDRSLEEALSDDANVFVNATKALAIQDFQGGAFLLAKAIREGRVKAIRRRRPKLVQIEFPKDEFRQTR